MSKTRDMKQCIEDRLLDWGFGRGDGLIALGGGVITDIAGFVAANYCRGIAHINVPTTLMGMIDAAIGGKCAVNTPHGKNLIGAFYPPKKVIIDTTFLETLPEQEWQNGYAEVIKYALISDPEILEIDDQLTLIKRCIAIKQAIVANDPKEGGYRRILNFGHTVGHAIEHLSNYRIGHGEAIAMGMVVEGALSGIDLKTIFLERGYSLDCSFDPDKLIDAMESDKKATSNTPRFVSLEKIGTPFPFSGEYCCEYSRDTIREVLCETIACQPI